MAKVDKYSNTMIAELKRVRLLGLSDESEEEEEDSAHLPGAQEGEQEKGDDFGEEEEE